MAYLDLLHLTLVFTVGFLLVDADNLQSWSHFTYKDEPYSLECKPTLEPSNVITWERDGMEGMVMADDHFELQPHDGVANGTLHVKKVNDATRGIYICRIDNGTNQESVVLGLNVGEHKYRDNIDKYRWSIIVGVITGGSVFVFLISVCLLAHFRYLSEESLEKRRQRKEAHLRMGRTKNGLANGSYENEGNHATNVDATQVNYL